MYVSMYVYVCIYVCVYVCVCVFVLHLINAHHDTFSVDSLLPITIRERHLHAVDEWHITFCVKYVNTIALFVDSYTLDPWNVRL